MLHLPTFPDESRPRNLMHTVHGPAADTLYEPPSGLLPGQQFHRRRRVVRRRGRARSRRARALLLKRRDGRVHIDGRGDGGDGGGGAPLRLEHGLELLELHTARPIRVVGVEERVDLGSRDVETESGHRLAELLLGHLAVLVLVPLSEEVDDARRILGESEAQLLGDRKGAGRHIDHQPLERARGVLLALALRSLVAVRDRRLGPRGRPRAVRGRRLRRRLRSCAHRLELGPQLSDGGLPPCRLVTLERGLALSLLKLQHQRRVIRPLRLARILKALPLRLRLGAEVLALGGHARLLLLERLALLREQLLQSRLDLRGLGLLLAFDVAQLLDVLQPRPLLRLSDVATLAVEHRHRRLPLHLPSVPAPLELLILAVEISSLLIDGDAVETILGGLGAHPAQLLVKVHARCIAHRNVLVLGLALCLRDTLRLSHLPIRPPVCHRRRQGRSRQPRACRRQHALLPRRLLPLLLPRGEAARNAGVGDPAHRLLVQVRDALLLLRLSRLRHLLLEHLLARERLVCNCILHRSAHLSRIRERRLERRLRLHQHDLQPALVSGGCCDQLRRGTRRLGRSALPRRSVPLVHPQRHRRRQGRPRQPRAR
eukprot:scaffold79414_cov60-Phaeocystis_antarctica.AAC.4